MRVTRLVNVADVGTPINPKIVETQLSGAAIMQLGFTLFEKMEFDAQGQLRNASLAEYKIPGMLDLPAAMVNEAVAAEQRTGPFGAQGRGRDRHLRRLAGDRQRDPRRGRRAADRAAA